jgi:hypothetical protein
MRASRSHFLNEFNERKEAIPEPKAVADTTAGLFLNVESANTLDPLTTQTRTNYNNFSHPSGQVDLRERKTTSMQFEENRNAS